ncbi:IclR family transcriptional regulator [Tetragenococcus halophilus]|uniref:IclR family transcriptional regulator n=1 Tax=Tetragenococcus halophilus TaxID=51669 RepID=UPI0021BB9240|nr:IclR family transcriptional regulator [Tetragenococcus halophilus]MCT8311231.1 IclR family transcriptional regulator [Tetragenococcus halophilus]
MKKEQKPYGTVLFKAAKILDYLSNNPESSLQDIVKGVDSTSSTTLKILDTLVLIGYVTRQSNKIYRLGNKLIQYADQNTERKNLVDLTQPYLEELQSKIDETIHLGILDNNEIFYLNKIEPKSQTVLMSSKIGNTRPLYNSAMGKAVLAEFTDKEIEQYLLSANIIPYTVHTKTNPDEIKKEIMNVRKHAVAYDNEEVEKDIFCIGASLINNNKILGAFSISMPKYRVNNSFSYQMAKEIRKTKTEIEKVINDDYSFADYE